MKSKIENVTKKLISDKCDEKGNMKASNSDTKTKQGFKSLNDIVKEGELLVAPSDTLSNSVENYVSAMEPHVKNDDPVITLKDKARTEFSMVRHYSWAGSCRWVRTTTTRT